MRDRSNKIIWTKQEQDKLFAAVKPLWESDSGQSMANLVKLAQDIVLDEHRRRKFVMGPSHIPTYLREKMLEGKIGTVANNAGIRKPEEKTKDQLRIDQLGEERDAAFTQVEALQARIKSLESENRTLQITVKAIPSEVEVIKGFLADILRRSGGLWTQPQSTSIVEVGKALVNGKHDPTPQSEGTVRLHRIVIVGGYKDTVDRLRDELAQECDLRWVDTDGSPTVGKTLRAYRDKDHGRVIVWTNHTRHGAEASLTYEVVPFTRYTGERNGLLQLIRTCLSEMG